MAQAFERWMASLITFLKFTIRAIRYLLLILGGNALFQKLVRHRLPILSMTEVVVFVAFSVSVALLINNPPDEHA